MIARRAFGNGHSVDAVVNVVRVSLFFNFEKTSTNTESFEELLNESG